MMTKKEARKVEKNRKLMNRTSNDNDVSKIIKIISAVVACFALVYFGTEIISKNLNNKKDDVEPEIQKVEILMGETFEKTDGEYVIVYYDFTDKTYANLYAMLVDNYNSKGKKIPMYKVDLSTNFSKKYTATEEEKSNTKPTSLSNLKVKGATLIRIKDKKVVKYVEGKDNIKSYIDEIIK